MNTSYKDFVEEVRNRTSIVSIVEEDAQLNRKGNVLLCCSPLRDDKDPSFAVYPNTESWFDFGTGEGGDVFEYIQKKIGCSFSEAVEILAERCGLEPYWLKKDFSDSEIHDEETSSYEERIKVEHILTLATAYYHKNLPNKIRDEFYKQKYGFTDDTINDLQLGWADGKLYKYLKRELEEEDHEYILKTGLFVKIKGGGVKDFFKNRLFFPYWFRGRVVYAIARRAEPYTSDDDWEKAKYKKLLTHGDNHTYVSKTVSNEWFYNEDALVRRVKRAIITEGVTDCISAKQAGIPCISPVTTRFRERDIPKLLVLAKKADQFIICNDADVLPDGTKPGEDGAVKTSIELHKAGNDVRIAELPRPDGLDKIDLNEFTVNNPIEELENVLKNAKAYPDFLLSKVDTSSPTREQNEIYKQVCELVCSCSELELERYTENICKTFRISKPQVRATIKASRKRQKEEGRQEDKKKKQEAKKRRSQIDESIRGKIYEDLGFYYVKTEKGGVEHVDVISSFVITTRYKIDTGTTQLIVGDITSSNDHTTNKFVFPKSTWVSRKDLIKALPNPDLMWTGSDDNVQYLMQNLANADVPTYKGTDNLGYFEDADGRRWVTSEYVIDQSGHMKTPDIVYYGNYESLNRRMKYSELSKDEVKDVAKEVLAQLTTLNVPEVVIPVLGWFFSTPFKPRINQLMGHFPILVIWGTQGSGKTSIVREIFWPLLGVARKTDPYSVTETDFALMRLQAATDSIPVFLDEYKPKDMGKIKMEKLHRALRRGYGGETEERGRQDLTIVSFHLHAPIVLAGESKPMEDAALLERMISVCPEKNTIVDNPDMQRNFRQVSVQNLSALASYIITYSLGCEIEKTMEDAKKTTRIILTKIKKIDKTPLRCFDNLAVMVFGILQYEAICENLGVEVPDIELEPIFEALTEEMLEGGDGVKSALDSFIESLSVYAQSGDLQDEKHYTYIDNKLHINLPLCYEVYLEQRRSTGRGDDTNGLKSLKRIIRENKKRGGYVTDSGKQIKLGNTRPRCVVIDSDLIPEGLEFTPFPKKQPRLWGGGRYDADNDNIN